MLTFNVKADLREVERYLSDVQKKLVPRAAGSALNKTARAVRTIASRDIRQRWNLKASVVSAYLKSRRVGYSRLAYEVVASGSPIPLKEYGARTTRKGVTFLIKKGGGRKLYKRQGRPGFIVDKFGGHVFVRIEDNPPGPKEARIKKVFGPSLPHYFVTKDVQAKLLQTAREVWPKRFAEELNYQLNIRGR